MSSPAPHRQVTVRPTPKLIPLLVLGAVAAVVVALVVTFVTPSSPDYSLFASVGYLTFLFSIPGLLLAAVVWLVLERRSRRHTRTYEAEPLTPASRTEADTPETPSAERSADHDSR
jgi:hypothetical protein